MSDTKKSHNLIIHGLIIIAIYFIFWNIVRFLLTILSLGLKLHPKKSLIIDDQNPNSLQDL